MAKKIFSVAALWLALVLLVFVYTDRQEYTWSFSGEALSGVLESCGEAAAREQKAADAMALEKAEAAQRASRGEWGKRDQYDGAPQTRPAVDPDFGLNLMWGEYEAAVSYSAGAPVEISTVSALRQPFIRCGKAVLEPGANEAVFSFTLTDAAEQVAFACDLPEGAEIYSITVHKAGAGVFSRDLAAYAAVAGGILTLLLVLSWKPGEAGVLARRDALAIILTALFACMPLLWRGVYAGHDLFFHLNRIEGMASAMRAGQLPVRIHASTLLGYGYAAPQFYPELFLYIPAVLRNLGVSLSASVRVFEVLITLVTAAACYFSARGLLHSRRIALGASMLYTLCSYRLSNMYVRATMGESLAMIFFPVLILALYEVLCRDEKRWPLLALAMTGIFMSHLLSTLFAAGLCAVCALCCAKHLIQRPARLLACVKAAGLTAVCSMGFLVPFLAYAGENISTSVAVMAGAHALTPGALFVGYPGIAKDLPYAATDFAYTVGVVPGLAIVLGCALLVIRRYAAAQPASREDKICHALMIIGGVLMLGATKVFPWDWACNLPRPYSTFFMQIQYPWRLVGVACAPLAFAASWGYLREKQTRSQALCLMAALCMVFSGMSMQAVVQDVPMLGKEDFCDTRIEQYEYTYERTEKGALLPGEIVALDAPVCTVSDYEKQGTNLRFTLDVPQSLSSLEVPLLYYPGYHAEANGQSLRVSIGNNNVIRLYGVPAGEDIAIRVWYQEPALWTASTVVSLAGFALMAALLIRRRKRA